MDKLGDNVLTLIFSGVHDPKHRKSLSLVNKRFLIMEGLSRLSLRVLEPDLLIKFLPRFPNLRYFSSPKPLNDGQLEFVSKTCPRIEVLNLWPKKHHVKQRKFRGIRDLKDPGVCAIAKGCCGLREASLNTKKGVGDFGVISLVNSAVNLTKLDLRWCKLITDHSLKAIGESKSIISLNLQGCVGISDEGLAWLAKGSVSKSLKTLIIRGCVQITDAGFLLIQSMSCLEVLDITCPGSKVTDIGCLEIAKISTLKELNLSWLVNLTDVSVIAFARNCPELEVLNLRGCQLVTGVGFLAFRNHGSLKSLVLSSCYKVSCYDVKEVALTCESLTYIVLDKWWKCLIPNSILDDIKNHCVLKWSL